MNRVILFKNVEVTEFTISNRQHPYLSKVGMRFQAGENTSRTEKGKDWQFFGPVNKSTNECPAVLFDKLAIVYGQLPANGFFNFADFRFGKRRPGSNRESGIISSSSKLLSPLSDGGCGFFWHNLNASPHDMMKTNFVD